MPHLEAQLMRDSQRQRCVLYRGSQGLCGCSGPVGAALPDLHGRLGGPSAHDEPPACRTPPGPVEPPDSSPQPTLTTRKRACIKEKAHHCKSVYGRSPSIIFNTTIKDKILSKFEFKII